MKFFYLQKSDRRVILLLMCGIVAALIIISITESETPADNTLEQVKQKKENLKELLLF